jgi:hypothetical protein
MNDIFGNILRKFVLDFFYDILIYSQSWEVHLQHLTCVFEILRANHPYVTRDKYSFGQPRVHYLGHIIDKEGLAVDPDKVQAMPDWPKPHNLRGLWGFLGLTEYY